MTSVANRVRLRTLVLGLVAAGAVVAVLRHNRGFTKGHEVPGGILVGDAGAYDTFSRFLLGPLFRGIAADIIEVARAGARVIEIGSGPGHLSTRLARHKGLDVTGVDLDPAMVEQARANADEAFEDAVPSLSFQVGDAASLPYPDGSVDLVVSTLSFHHWADPPAALNEIGRVLRPGAQALVWDFRPRIVPFHMQPPDPVESARDTPLQIVSITPWRWPWRFSLLQRIELINADD